MSNYYTSTIQNQYDRTFFLVSLLLCFCFGVNQASVYAAEKIEKPEINYLEAKLVGLPSILYVTEKLNFGLQVSNKAPRPLHLDITYSDGSKELQKRSLRVEPRHEGVAMFSLQVESLENTSRRLAVYENKQQVLNEEFKLVNGRGSLEGIFSYGYSFVDSHKDPVVLLNTYENEMEYRRWAPLKWIGRQIDWSNSDVVLSTPCEALPSALMKDDCGTLSLGKRDVRFIQYSGDLFAQIKSFPELLDADKPIIVCLLWGTEECHNGLSARMFKRGMDLLIDRIKVRNPKVQFVLGSNLPLAGTENKSLEFKEIIRKLVEEHHCYFLDVYSGIVTCENWEQLYRLDGDKNVTCLFPSERTREWVTGKIAEALQ